MGHPLRNYTPRPHAYHPATLSGVEGVHAVHEIWRPGSYAIARCGFAGFVQPAETEIDCAACRKELADAESIEGGTAWTV